MIAKYGIEPTSWLLNSSPLKGLIEIRLDHLKLQNVVLPACHEHSFVSVRSPGACYFHMIAGTLVSRDIASTVMADIDARYGYLGGAYLSLLKGWLDDPYSL